MSFAMDYTNNAVRPGANLWGDGGDQRKHVVFYTRPVLDPVRSAAEGRPYFNDVIHVRMQDPGDNLQVTDRPATDSDKQRFPQHWRNFEAGRGEEQPGTPVDFLFPDKPSIVARLRHANVRTVEALAEVSAEGMRTIGMGAMEWSQAAAKFLKLANDSKAQTQMNAELEKRDLTIATLKAQIEDLTRIVSSLKPATPMTGEIIEPPTPAARRRTKSTDDDEI